MNSINISTSFTEVPQRKKKTLENKTPQILCVDINNYNNYFFNMLDHWDLERPIKLLSEFIESARKSNFELVIFLDAIIKTDYTMNEYKTRRENELENWNFEQKELIPTRHNIIYGSFFKKKGIKVHYSVEEDNDDTLATFAYYDNGFILSGDKDFLCYDQKFKVFKTWEINNGRLELIPQDNFSKKIGKIFREILPKKPKTAEMEDWALHNLGPNFNRFLKSNPSSLIWFYPNIYKITQDLRTSLYNILGIKNKINEEFIKHDVDKNGKHIALWEKYEINPENALDYYKEILEKFLIEDLIKDYEFKLFFDYDDLQNRLKKNIWNNHVFSLISECVHYCVFARISNKINYLSYQDSLSSDSYYEEDSDDNNFEKKFKDLKLNSNINSEGKKDKNFSASNQKNNLECFIDIMTSQRIKDLADKYLLKLTYSEKYSLRKSFDIKDYNKNRFKDFKNFNNSRISSAREYHKNNNFNKQIEFNSAFEKYARMMKKK